MEPRYQQITLDKSLEKNDFAQILSPNPDDAGVWIHQDAWFYLSDFDNGFSKKLALKKEGNGFYISIFWKQPKLFQIRLFPKYRNVEPRYQQITLDKSLEKNDFAQILSPNPDDAGVWIHQDASLS